MALLLGVTENLDKSYDLDGVYKIIRAPRNSQNELFYWLTTQQMNDPFPRPIKSQGALTSNVAMLTKYCAVDCWEVWDEITLE